MALSETEAKIVAIVALGIGSFVIGVFPACFTGRGGQRKLLLSSLLCFGGGVLLATSLLHMLPEVREQLPEYAELVFCGGFLLLYLIDEVVHYFWGKEIDPPPQSHTHNAGDTHDFGHGLGHSHSRRISCSNTSHFRENSNLHNDREIGYNGPSTSRSDTRAHDGFLNLAYEPNVKSNITFPRNNRTYYGTVPTVHPTAPDVPAQCCDEEGTLLCHGTHTEPCSNTNTGLAGLLMALTLHALLEGLAIGVQTKADEVLLLVGAVASHKFVVGFCLGVELTATAGSVLKHTIAIAVFAGGSSLGIFIGMLVSQVDQSWMTDVMPVLQGLAGGTLLYVTVSEVLPRERARWHRTARRSAGMIQFLSVSCGFFLMYILNKYMESAHGTDNNPHGKA